MLIFTSFEFCACAKRNFQTLNSAPGVVVQLVTNIVNISLLKGTVPKRLDICYNFGTFNNIQHLYLVSLHPVCLLKRAKIYLQAMAC